MRGYFTICVDCGESLYDEYDMDIGYVFGLVRNMKKIEIKQRELSLRLMTCTCACACGDGLGGSMMEGGGTACG